MTEFSTRLAAIAHKNIGHRTNPKVLLVGIALAFIGTAFVVSELMHYLLVPDLGQHGERMMAEGISALLIGGLAAVLFRIISNGGRLRLRACK